VVSLKENLSQLPTNTKERLGNKKDNLVEDIAERVS
jgi:hypothetical protein